MTIQEKQETFAIRNRMIDLPYNFPKNKEESKCDCGEIESMQHIYETIKSNSKDLLFEKIFNGNITEIEIVYRNFKEKLERRSSSNQYCKMPRDPLLWSAEFLGNGF